MKNKHLFFSLLIALLAFSCSSDDGGGTTEPQTESIKLTAFVKDTDRYTVSYTDGTATAITKPDNSVITLDYNTSGKLIRFENTNYIYDTTGKLASVQNENGISHFEYDEDILVKQTVTNNFQATITRVFTYNSANNLIKIREIDNIIDGVDIIDIRLVYNTDGLISKRIYEESRNNGASFDTLSEIRITYEEINNPFALFRESLGFTNAIVPLFNNPLNFETNLIFNLGKQNDFLLSYIPSKVINSLRISGRELREDFDYNNSNTNYPVTARSVWQDDIGINGTTEYAWEYTTD